MRSIKSSAAWAASLALIAAGLATPASAQTPTGLSIKDGNGAAQTLCAITIGGNTSLANCASLFVAGLPVSASNPVFVTPGAGAIFSFNLPALAATSALQPSLNADGGGLAHVTNFPTIQAVSAAALPLPAGAATAANQSAEISAMQSAASSLQGPLSLAAGQSHLGEVGSLAVNAVAANPITTPSGTSNYTVGLGIMNSASGASVTPMTFQLCAVTGGTGVAYRARITTTDTAFLGTTVRLHLHQTAPTYTNGDHAAWLTTSSGYLGAFDVTFDKGFSDVVEGIGVPVVGSSVTYTCAAGSQVVYGELEERATVTPTGGKVFTPSIEALEN